MFQSVKSGRYNFLQSIHERTSLIKKNIFFSVFLKGGSVIITFLIVPLTINYISPVQYGIWLTISSMIYWINVFDIGIGNGLKNKIAYALAINDEEGLKKYVSTCYAVLTIIALFIFLTFWCISSFLDWNKFLNISKKINYNIRPVILVVVGFFCIQFVVQLIDAVLSATQQVFKSSLILFIGQFIGLIIIYLLTLFVPGNLLLLVIVMAGSSVLALIIASLYLYIKELKKFTPNFKYIDFKCSREILNVGAAFFLIQIGAMILINANNFIITQILGPEAVAVYNIPFRLFSFISMLFAIIIMPYWSAFTDAYAKNDMDWIKKSIRKLRIIWLLLSMLGMVVFLFSNLFYKIWIHNAVFIPILLSFCMLVYMLIYTWHSLHVYFLNGIGKIRLQLYVVVIGVLFNVPLAIYLGKIYGLPGIVGANSITFALMGSVYTVQYQKIVSGTATKLWNQ